MEGHAQQWGQGYEINIKIKLKGTTISARYRLTRENSAS
jgi:hypothetical protein